MSFECMAWAIRQKTGGAIRKIVLLHLANTTNHQTGMCRPRIKMIAEECEISETSVKDAIKGLVAKGLLEVKPRFFEGQQLANDYRLAMEGIESDKGGVGRHATQGGSPDDPGWVATRPPYNQGVEPGSRTSLSAPKGAGREKAQELVDLWNSMSREGGFPRARLTTPRMKVLATRLKDPAWEEDFRKAIAWMALSPAAGWYRGKNDRSWVADLDFLLQGGKATELAEKSTVMDKAPEKVETPQAEIPKWKADKIAVKRLNVEAAKREIKKLEAQGFTRATCAMRFAHADRELAKAEEELQAELGRADFGSAASAPAGGKEGQ